MKALLVANGEIEDINLLVELSSQVDFILAVDGGSGHCIQAKVDPDLIIGDLDSIGEETLKTVVEKGIEIIRYPSKKNATDAEISLDYLVDRGYREIILLGSIGSRLDHSLGNIYLLEYLYRKKVDGKIVNSKNTVFVLSGEKTIRKEKKYISIIPLSDDGIVISLKGLIYPLDKKYVKRGSSLTISNEFEGESCIIDISRGLGLVVQSED